MRSAFFVGLVLVLCVAWGQELASGDVSLIEQGAFLGVPHSAVNVKLERWDLPEENMKSVISNIRMRQMDMESTSFIEASATMGDVQLQREVLREKHIATYYGKVEVGGHEFRVLFDTGSCEFWVPSSACNTARCSRHNRYPVDQHRFKEFAAQRLNIQYLSGHVQGPMSWEQVRIGDVVVPKQLVGLADDVNIALLDDVVWDGIVGLAYPNANMKNRGVSPIFDTIMAQQILRQKQLSNQFAYYIDDNGGTLTMGGANCDLITPQGSPAAACVEKFGFVPISHKTYWTIQMNDVAAKFPDGRVVRGLCPPGGCKAIVDTGTYLMYGPAAQVRKILPTSLGFCGSLTSLPTLSFEFKVPGNWPVVSLDLKPEEYILNFDVNGRKDCVMGLSPDKETMWTLGQVFLRTYYTLFDRDNNRIGFARVPKTGPTMSTIEASAETSESAEVEAEESTEAETEESSEAEAEESSEQEQEQEEEVEFVAPTIPSGPSASEALKRMEAHLKQNQGMKMFAL